MEFKVFITRIVVLTCFFYLHVPIQAQKKFYEIGSEDAEAILLDTVYHQELNTRIFEQKEAYVKSAKDGKCMEMSDHLQELSFIHLRMEDYDMALSYLYGAKEIAEEHGNEVELAIVRRRIGTIYTEMGLNDKGLESLMQSLKTLEKYSDRYCVDLTKAYKNIGLNYVRQGKYENCETYFRKALSTAIKCGMKGEIASDYANLSGVLIYYEKYDSVNYYLDKAEELFDTLNDSLGLGTVNNNRAEYYMNIGEYEKSLFLYERAYGFYCSAKEDQFRLGTLKNLALINEKLGNTEQALKYSKDYAAANAGLLHQKLEKTVENMDVSFSQFQKRKNIENELILRNKQNKIKSYQVYLLSSLLVALLVVGGLLVYHRIMKEKLIKVQLEKEKIAKSNLKEEIDFKDRELEGLALNITNKNRFLYTLREKLNDLNSDQKDFNKQVRELKFLISQYLQSDRELADFNERVELLQQNFLYSLSEAFPDLSENDKQLCVLLRLGISSKDIALMRNVSEKSVHMARYRLRKKMKLDSNDNLVEYLKKI